MKIDGNTPITLTLALDQVNAVLSSLGSQPFDRVANIITSIQRQATEQLGAMQASAPSEEQQKAPGSAE